MPCPGYKTQGWGSQPKDRELGLMWSREEVGYSFGTEGD